MKPAPNQTDKLSFPAAALVRDVTAILTALLQGRDSCDGRLHFKVERGRRPTFTLVVDDDARA
jgi:hypothetical protein